MSGTVSLVSGGIDSTLMTKIFKDEGVDQQLLYVNFEQPSANMEWRACNKITNFFGLELPVRINLGDYWTLLNQFGFDITRISSNDFFIPGRNLILLWVASFVAFAEGYDSVAIGLIKPGNFPFPDQVPEFIVNTEYALSSTFGKKISVRVPLAELTKNEVVRLSTKNRVPLDMTYSCQKGRERYCGSCISCIDIKLSGFESLFKQFTLEE